MRRRGEGGVPPMCPILSVATGVGGGSRLLDGAFEGIDERRTGTNAALHGRHGPGMLGHARDGCRCAPVRVAARLGSTHRKAMEAQASRPPEPSPSPGPQPDKPTGTALCPSAKAQAGSCAALAPAPARRCCASRSDDARITRRQAWTSTPTGRASRWPFPGVDASGYIPRRAPHGRAIGAPSGLFKIG